MLEVSRIRAGVWEARARGQERPELEVTHLGEPVSGLVVEGGPGDWILRLPIPSELLSDGVQSFLVRDAAGVVDRFTIVTGAPLDGDLRAEIELMRAELDMLKAAFRRHMSEG